MLASHSKSPLSNKGHNLRGQMDETGESPRIYGGGKRTFKGC
jgi:hypothetical protein